MKKFLRVFRTEEEYLEYTASTEFNLNSVSRCREGSLVFFNPESCGSQVIHRTISGETYCDGYDKRVYIYKQVSYDDGVTWETTATTSSLIEKDSEDCGYVPPTQYDIINNVYSNGSSSPTKIVNITNNFSEVEIDGVVQPSVESAYTLDYGEHTVKYKLTGTSIASRAFYGCRGIKTCTIANNITSIGSDAFNSCGGLISITIPDSVTTIGYSAFENCGRLTNVTIPDSVTSIGNGAFYNCSGLTSIDIPDSVTSIGDSVFQYCNDLTTCTIGSGITAIYNSTFSGCYRLKNITIPNNIRSIGSFAFMSCTSLTSVTIPDSVTVIGWGAFKDCSSLTSVTIGDNITTISYGALQNCSSLRSITIEATVPPTLENDVFDNTNNCPIYVPCDSVDAYKTATKWSTYTNRIQAIPGSCPPVITAKFSVTSTTRPTRIASGTTDFSKIEIDGVEMSKRTEYTFSTIGEHTVKYYLVSTSIGSYDFEYCYDIMSVDISDGVNSIGRSAFYGCNGLTSVTIPNSVTSIGDYAFCRCSSLTSVTIPNSVTSMGFSVFSNCYNLTRCTINGSSVGEQAFASCSGLTSVTIGNSVTSIGGSAFDFCKGLKRITSNAIAAPTIQSNTFRDIKARGTLYVPQGSSGYDTWMLNTNYYLGLYGWTKVEQ